jgi:hypothetical protein
MRREETLARDQASDGEKPGTATWLLPSEGLTL